MQNFWTIFAYLNSTDKEDTDQTQSYQDHTQIRLLLKKLSDRVIRFCYSFKHFANFNSKNRHFIWKKEIEACQENIVKQRRPRSDFFWKSSLIGVFPVCYSDKHICNSSSYYLHFIWIQKYKSVRIFRTLVACRNSIDLQRKPRSVAVWSGSSLFAILTTILWIQTLITSIFMGPD